jgi:hypothetical protein
VNDLEAMREDMEARLARKPERCPRCGGGDLRYMIWGLPVNPASYMGENWREKVALGGCSIPPDGCPEWRCQGCGLEFSLRLARST